MKTSKQLPRSTYLKFQKVFGSCKVTEFDTPLLCASQRQGEESRSNEEDSRLPDSSSGIRLSLQTVIFNGMADC